MYMDPKIVPNRRHWLVLRKLSRERVRHWLRNIDELSDREIGEQFAPVVMSRFRVNIPDRPKIGRALRKLTTPTDISPEALDAYLRAHPDGLVGNAEAHLCPRHTGYLRDIPALRHTLGMLLDSSIEIQRRIDEVIGGPYKLSGFGAATATTIVECWNDGLDEGKVNGVRYSKWTGHTERALAKLGIRFRALTPGQTYGNIWDVQRGLLYDFPEFDSLSDVDLLMYVLDPRGLGMG